VVHEAFALHPVSYTHLDVYKRQEHVSPLRENIDCGHPLLEADRKWIERNITNLW